MKKILSVLLVCVVVVSLFVACGKNDEVKEKPDNTITQEVQNTPEDDSKSETPKKTEKTLEVSENKEVVTAETAPEVLIIEDGGSDNARICYHLKNCKTLQGTKNQTVTWEFIEMLQFRQCPECNPPRYNGYVEQFLKAPSGAFFIIIL